MDNKLKTNLVLIIITIFIVAIVSFYVGYNSGFQATTYEKLVQYCDSNAGKTDCGNFCLENSKTSLDQNFVIK